MKQHLHNLDALALFVDRGVCVAVVATAHDGSTAVVPASSIDVDGTELVVGPVRVDPDRVLLSQMDEDACEIVLVMDDGRVQSLRMVPADVDLILA